MFSSKTTKLFYFAFASSVLLASHELEEPVKEAKKFRRFFEPEKLTDQEIKEKLPKFLATLSCNSREMIEQMGNWLAWNPKEVKIYIVNYIKSTFLIVKNIVKKEGGGDLFDLYVNLEYFVNLEIINLEDQEEEIIVGLFNLIMEACGIKSELKFLNVDALKEFVENNHQKCYQTIKEHSEFGVFDRLIRNTLDKEPDTNHFLLQDMSDAACVLGGQIGAALHIPRMREALKDMIKKEDKNFVWFKFPTPRLKKAGDGEDFTVKVRKEVHKTAITPVSRRRKVSPNELSDYDLWYNLLGKAYYERFISYDPKSFYWYRIILNNGSIKMSTSPLWGTYQLSGGLPSIRRGNTMVFMDYPKMAVDVDGNVYVTVPRIQRIINDNIKDEHIEKINNLTINEGTDIDKYCVVKLSLKGVGYISTTVLNGMHHVALYFDEKEGTWMYYDNQSNSDPKPITAQEVNNGRNYFKGVRKHDECLVTVVSDEIWHDVFQEENMFPLSEFVWPQ